jgi:WD40 repeat protein
MPTLADVSVVPNTERVNSFAISPDEAQIAVARSSSLGDSCALVDPVVGSTVHASGGVRAYLPTFTQCGLRVGYRTYDGVRIMGCVMGGYRDIPFPNDENPCGLYPSGADQLSAIVLKGTEIYRWDLSSGHRDNVFDVGPGKMIFTLPIVSPDGKYLLTYKNEDGSTVHLWSLKEKRYLGPLQSGRPFAVAFANTKPWVAIATKTGFVHIWNIETLRKVATVRGHTDIVRTISWYRDDTMLLTGSRDETIGLWDAVNGFSHMSGLTVEDEVNQVAFFPESEKFAYCNYNSPNVYVGYLDQ